MNVLIFYLISASAVSNPSSRELCLCLFNIGTHYIQVALVQSLQGEVPSLELPTLLSLVRGAPGGNTCFTGELTHLTVTVMPLWTDEKSGRYISYLYFRKQHSEMF